MPAAVEHVQSSRSKHVIISVPANAGTAQRIIELALSATASAPLESGDRCQVMGGRIAAAVTSYSVGDTAASLPWVVAVGFEYEEPTCDWLDSFIKSSGAAFDIALTVYLAGNPVPGVAV